MATSDERREVAERLRRTKAECDARDCPWMVEDLMQALGLATYEDGEDGIFDRLADLVDPTCHDFGGQEGTTGEGYDFACSACGYACDLPQPRFCPRCGARVMDGDAR